MFLERLLLLCNQKNTDISTVLRTLGLSTSKGTAWRKGSIPNGEILLMLANHFDVSTDYLLGNTDNSRPLSEISGDAQKNPTPTGVDLTVRQKEAMDLVVSMSEEQLEQFIRIARAYLGK